MVAELTRDISSDGNLEGSRSIFLLVLGVLGVGVVVGVKGTSWEAGKGGKIDGMVAVARGGKAGR